MWQPFRMVRVCHCKSTLTDAIPRRVSIGVSRPGHLHLQTGGVDIDSPAITTFVVQMQPSSEGTHLPMARMRLSPLWCATICMHAPVVRLLLRWRENQKEIAQCALCAGDQCSCGQAFTTGLTPPEFASRHMDDSEEIVGGLNSACSTKRKRRGTPMKERAVKAGVSLAPTPADGIRAPLADEPPATNKKRRSRKRSD